MRRDVEGSTAEIGYPNAAYQFWTGLFAPAKTPAVVVNKIHLAAERALKVPAVSERLSQMGVEPLPLSVEQFGKFFREDVLATVRLAKEAGIGPAN